MDAMVMFSYQEELADWLAGIDPDYSRYAARLWADGAKTVKELADASIEQLKAAGINGFAAASIKGTAGVHG
jgi:hypothetical protein